MCHYVNYISLGLNTGGNIWDSEKYTISRDVFDIFNVEMLSFVLLYLLLFLSRARLPRVDSILLRDVRRSDAKSPDLSTATPGNALVHNLHVGNHNPK